jgi:energy-coupling factor transporter ATP-binding protein EcfA2
MLKRIYADNFRCLVNFDLKLGAKNVLMGNNGAGKSASLQCLGHIRKLIIGEGQIRDYFDKRSLTRWDKRTNQTFELEADLPQGNYVYKITIEHGTDSELCRVSFESLSCSGKPLFKFEGGRARLFNDDARPGPEVLFDWTRSGISAVLPRGDNRLLTEFKNFISRILLLRPNPALMSDSSEGEVDYPGEDLSQFVGWLRHFSQEDPEQFTGFVAMLRSEIFPELKALRFPHQTTSEARVLYATLQAGLTQGPQNYELRFNELSDGQKMLIALHAIVAFGLRAGVMLCLDEPANFLSLPEIQPWLLKLSDKVDADNGQCLLISHHPEIINLLSPEHGQWLERNDGGPTRITPVGSGRADGLTVSELITRGWLHG